MAGEWIAYDLALPHKPEVQELIDLTGQPSRWSSSASSRSGGGHRCTVPMARPA